MYNNSLFLCELAVWCNCNVCCGKAMRFFTIRLPKIITPGSLHLFIIRIVPLGTGKSHVTRPVTHAAISHYNKNIVSFCYINIFYE